MVEGQDVRNKEAWAISWSSSAVSQTFLKAHWKIKLDEIGKFPEGDLRRGGKEGGVGEEQNVRNKEAWATLWSSSAVSQTFFKAHWKIKLDEVAKFPAEGDLGNEGRRKGGGL